VQGGCAVEAVTRIDIEAAAEQQIDASDMPIGGGQMQEGATPFTAGDGDLLRLPREAGRAPRHCLYSQLQ
jgi:hypothetical protein